MGTQPEVLKNGHLIPGIFNLQYEKPLKIQSPFLPFAKCKWSPLGSLEIKVNIKRKK